ncbi:MAG: redoxin domain-containing protein [Candidatus Aminicenantales bacterium]
MGLAKKIVGFCCLVNRLCFWTSGRLIAAVLCLAFFFCRQGVASEKFPNFSAKDVNGQIVRSDILRNCKTLFLFFRPSSMDHRVKISYAQVLFNKWKNVGLKVIAIAHESEIQTYHYVVRAGLSFPVIADPQAKLWGDFEMKECCGGILFSEPGGGVVFRSPQFLEIEDLRQLTEKMLFGRVSDNFMGATWSSPFLVGQKFPDLPVVEVLSGRIIETNEWRSQFTVLTFVSTICPVCKSGKRIQLLSEINRNLIDGKGHAAIKLMFFQPAEPADIESLEKILPMPFDKYIIEDFLSDDQKYITDESKKADPLTIIINTNREIVFVESIGMTEREISERVNEILSMRNP